ncbi:MAG: hypothetical protein D4S01_06385 [Dehalococcoidia bacterium]|nr:MAG: hypothetical protein D4S01_06385 [Dehalococcoidia bacterium]
MSCKGYYKRLSGKRYLCPICGSVYDSPFARKEAQDCCQDKKLANFNILDEANHIAFLVDHPPVKERRPHDPANPHPGVKQPDKYGHWYRGKVLNEKKVEAQYQRAFKWIDRQARLTELQRLDALFAPWDAEAMMKPCRRSPLQRMAYAYFRHDWESLKLAAYALANEFADRYLRNFLNDKCAEIITEIDQLEKELDDDTESPL